MQRPLSSLGLPLAVQERLTSAKYVHAEELRGVSPVQLARELNVPMTDALAVLKAAQTPSMSILSVGSTLLAPRKVYPRISSGSAAVDRMLGGGVAIGEAIEFCGPPGMGKTQLGIQLAVNVQYPADLGGAGGRAVYIDTEGSFTAERVADMSRGMISNLRASKQAASAHIGGATAAAAASAVEPAAAVAGAAAATVTAAPGARPPPSQASASPCSLTASQRQRIAENRAVALKKRKVSAQKSQKLFEAAASTLDTDSMLSNIFVYRVYDCSEQLAVNYVLAEFLEQHRDIRLVIIDSIAFHFRHDYEEFAQRTRLLAAYSQSLTSLAHKFDVAIVLINQVTTKVTDRSDGAPTLVPALGNSWAHSCTSRCMLYWDHGERFARLIKSPNRPDIAAPYRIVSDGLRDVPRG